MLKVSGAQRRHDGSAGSPPPDPASVVSGLYEAHAVGFIRLAVIMLAEEHAEVLAALRKLPARQREALVLRFYLDLDEPAIAAAMGISAGTVKSTTSRAIASLGRLLRGEPGGEP